MSRKNRRKPQRTAKNVSLAKWRRIRAFVKRSIANTPVFLGIEGDSLVVRMGKDIQTVPLSNLVDYELLIMDIKNLKRANELGKELEELKLCRDLLLGGCYVKVVGNSEDTFGVIRDRYTREAILCSVKERIKAVEEEVKTL